MKLKKENYPFQNQHLGKTNNYYKFKKMYFRFMSEFNKTMCNIMNLQHFVKRIC